MIIFNFQFSISRKRGGFTLTELVVAMGLFLVAITLSVGGFVRVLKTQRGVNHLISVNSNASIILEQIAREIRTGYSLEVANFTEPVCPYPGLDELSFINAKGNKVSYKAENSEVIRRECALLNCGGKSFLPVTASNISVQRFCFAMTNPSQSPRTDPWRLTMFLSLGSSKPEFAGNALNIQTTVSSRILPMYLQ